MRRFKCIVMTGEYGWDTQHERILIIDKPNQGGEVYAVDYKEELIAPMRTLARLMNFEDAVNEMMIDNQNSIDDHY